MLLLITTPTTITMIWTLPSFTLQAYEGFRQCHKLCEETLGPTIHTNSSISSPYTFTGIDPGTYCIVGLNGIYYGNDTIVLGDENTTTLSSGKLLLSYSQLLCCSHIIYSTQFICQ